MRSPIPTKYLDIIFISMLYAVIFTSLLYFVNPLGEITSIENMLVNAFIYGAIAGFFSGFIGGLWVNRIDTPNPLPKGIVTGMTCSLIGSFLFPFLGGFISIFYLGEPSYNYLLEVYFLLNFSMISFAPAVFMGIITGGIGGLLTGEIGSVK